MEDFNALYMLYFATFSIFAGTTVPFIVQAWLEFVKPKTAVWKSIWSWIVPLVLGIAGWGLGLVFDGGFLAGLVWWHALIYGAWAAVMANVAWDNVPWLKELVNQLFIWLLSKTKK